MNFTARQPNNGGQPNGRDFVQFTLVVVSVKTETESPLGRKLRIALLSSASLFTGLFAVVLIFYRRTPPGDWLIYALLAALALTVIMGVIRFAHVMFAELQAPLGELLLTFLVAGAAMTASRSIYHSSAEEEVGPAILSMLLLSLAMLLGSIWGWSAAKRLNETQTRRRIGLLAMGWLLVPGIIAAASFVLTTAVSVIIGIPTAPFFVDRFWIFYAGSALASVLAIPALYCERRIGKLKPIATPKSIENSKTDLGSNLIPGHVDKLSSL